MLESQFASPYCIGLGAGPLLKMCARRYTASEISTKLSPLASPHGRATGLLVTLTEMLIVSVSDGSPASVIATVK